MSLRTARDPRQKSCMLLGEGLLQWDMLKCSSNHLMLFNQAFGLGFVLWNIMTEKCNKLATKDYHPAGTGKPGGGGSETKDSTFPRKIDLLA